MIGRNIGFGGSNAAATGLCSLATKVGKRPGAAFDKLEIPPLNARVQPRIRKRQIRPQQLLAWP
jgi:hypothetical protein